MGGWPNINYYININLDNMKIIAQLFVAKLRFRGMWVGPMKPPTYEASKTPLNSRCHLPFYKLCPTWCPVLKSFGPKNWTPVFFLFFPSGGLLATFRNGFVFPKFAPLVIIIFFSFLLNPKLMLSRM